MTVIAIFGLATITIAQVPSYVPTNGLQGYWPFNGNANDESGNGNNGTVNGATLTNDRFGNVNSAFSFINSSISFSNSNFASFGMNSFSCSVWVRYTNPGSSLGNFVRYGDGVSGVGWGMRYTGDSKINCLEYAVTNNNIASISPFNDNNWHNVIFIRDVSNLSATLYIDGSLIVTLPMISGYINDISTGLPFNIGTANGYESFVGDLDGIGIWNRALTQQEITDLYNGCQLSVNTQPTNQTINVNNNAQFVVSSSDPTSTFQWQTDLGVGFQNLNSFGQYIGNTNDTLTVTNVTMSNNNQPFRCIVSIGSCSDTSNVAGLTVNNNVGINETSQDNLFSVFPNPAQSLLNIKADSKLIGEVYTIYDNTGRVVLTGKVNSQNTTIELGNLSGGIYMFCVGENMNQTVKVIKE